MNEVFSNMMVGIAKNTFISMAVENATSLAMITSSLS